MTLSGSLAVGVVSLLISVTLFWAGIGKLVRPTAFAESLVRFRISRRPRRWMSGVVAVAEITIAIALWVPPVRVLAAAMAVLSFAFFSFLIVRSLRAGERFPCNCLGASGNELGLLELGRAVSLMGLSVALLVLVLIQTAEPSSASSIALSAVLACSIAAVAVLVAQSVTLLQFDQTWARGFRAMGRATSQQQEGTS